MHKILDSLKYIKLKDIFAPFIFLLAIIPAFIYKMCLAIAKRPLWLVCEDGNTARDNGYYFYKYMCEKHPEVNCRYVIRRSNSVAYDKIVKLGKKPIEMSSYVHYISYLAAKWNISNHKHGNPNQPLFHVVHVVLGIIRNRVFLQHGITKDDSPWIYYKNTKFKYFICGAEREYKYVKEKFGYPNDSVVLTGFPRFDTLIDSSNNKKQIVIMPTWRNWLGRDTNSFGKKEKFENTDFFKRWNSVLNNKCFIKYIEKEDIQVLFYPHQHMQKYIKYFSVKSKNIHIADMELDIQQVLRESFLMITDYSSVYMDFAYMKKPIYYYQFDVSEYRDRQLQAGYFEYDRDGFGPVYTNEKDLVRNIMSNKFSHKYIKRAEEFFRIQDTNNCQRIYNLLIRK